MKRRQEDILETSVYQEGRKKFVYTFPLLFWLSLRLKYLYKCIFNPSVKLNLSYLRGQEV